MCLRLILVGGRERVAARGGSAICEEVHGSSVESVHLRFSEQLLPMGPCVRVDVPGSSC